ncbi:MAG: hypothetical protein MUD01_14995 [Chloroflexaceae bacterium]|jgi:predicted glycosyltransferase|nr:hypothetical protein [Chloroflexaceae bacterium]
MQPLTIARRASQCRTSAAMLPPVARRYRVALYSHDTMGLGHTRRNQLIAQTLVASGLPVDVLLLRGMNEGNVPLPAGVDCLTLPALRKDADGRYGARSLSLNLADIIELRGQTIHAALAAYTPDVLIVDNVPRGAQHELDRALVHLRAAGRTRCILGLRDVLDDPASVRREWQQAANEATIANYYDAVWVYGDRKVYDPVRAYGFGPALAAKMRFTGYLDQRARLRHAPPTDAALPGLPEQPFALCMVGGGQDGMQLAEAFAQADLAGLAGVIVTGPFMPAAARARLHSLAAERDDLHILSYAAEPTLLLCRAERVVAMGGYNSVAEILSFEKRALIVPRDHPRSEQLIRAERLQSLNLLSMLRPDDLTPAALSAWLARDLPAPHVHRQLDMDGLARLPLLLAETLRLSDEQLAPLRLHREGATVYGTC